MTWISKVFSYYYATWNVEFEFFFYPTKFIPAIYLVAQTIFDDFNSTQINAFVTLSFSLRTQDEHTCMILIVIINVYNKTDNNYIVVFVFLRITLYTNILPNNDLKVVVFKIVVENQISFIVV